MQSFSDNRQQKPLKWCEISCLHSGQFQDMVFWDVMLYCFVQWHLHLRETCTEAGDSKLVEKFDTNLPNYNDTSQKTVTSKLQHQVF
jgi:hypothetical protein